MKISRPAILIGLICVSVFPFTSALAGISGGTDNRFTEQKLQLIERNLVIGLESGMASMQASAAIVLKQVKMAAPEYDFAEAIIPLMRIIKDEKGDITTRIAAAIVLHDLHSSRGDYAIKRTAQFTDVERVKRICLLLSSEVMREE